MKLENTQQYSTLSCLIGDKARVATVISHTYTIHADIFMHITIRIYIKYLYNGVSVCPLSGAEQPGPR